MWTKLLNLKLGHVRISARRQLRKKSYPHEHCNEFMMTFCKHCTFTCYWMDPHKVENRFISVPFPSAYHWWDGIKNVPWDSRRAHERNLTVVYLGSTQTLTPPHTKIRRAMVAQCQKSQYCEWLQLKHTSKDTSISDFLSVYKRSIFCLSPPGDDPGRKAVFDAIISGCIPVIFEPATLFNQYPWHFSEEDALDIAISIPGAKVRSNELQFMDFLLSIDMSVIRKKQEAIHRIAPTLQYSVPPPESLVNISDFTPWEPPFHDAADLTLEGMFDRVYHVIHNETVGIPKLIMSGDNWYKRYGSSIAHMPGTSTNYLPLSNVTSVIGPNPRQTIINHDHSHYIRRHYHVRPQKHEKGHASGTTGMPPVHNIAYNGNTGVAGAASPAAGINSASTSRARRRLRARRLS